MVNYRNTFYGSYYEPVLFTAPWNHFHFFQIKKRSISHKVAQQSYISLQNDSKVSVILTASNMQPFNF
jgi:hypothetical protein